MPDPQKVVIVDAQGTRHVFPAGFDPVKAGAIVRGQTDIGDVGPPMPASARHPLARLGEGVVESLNPVNWYEGLKQTIRDPSGGMRAKEAVEAKRREAFQQPEPLAAVRALDAEGAKDVEPVKDAGSLLTMFAAPEAALLGLRGAGGVARASASVASKVAAAAPGARQVTADVIRKAGPAVSRVTMGKWGGKAGAWASRKLADLIEPAAPAPFRQEMTVAGPETRPERLLESGAIPLPQTLEDPSYVRSVPAEYGTPVTPEPAPAAAIAPEVQLKRAITPRKPRELKVQKQVMAQPDRYLGRVYRIGDQDVQLVGAGPKGVSLRAATKGTKLAKTDYTWPEWKALYAKATEQ